MDLDLRDIMEDFFKNTVTPNTSSLWNHQNAPESLSKAQIMEAVQMLNSSQFEAVSKAQADFIDEDKSDENVQQKIQLQVHT